MAMMMLTNANVFLVKLFICFSLTKVLKCDDTSTLETKIARYRKDFISHMLNHIPYTLSSFRLQNGGESPSLEENTVMFYLYNRKQPHNSLIINKDVHLVNPKWPVKVLVHGWTEHYYVQWCKNMTSAYLRKGKYNIIVLDWSKKGDADYYTASMSVKDVSKVIGDFIVNRLHKERNVSMKKIHLVSHSLGCHVAGLVGQRVLKKSGQKVARITALDPAAPIFDMFTMGNEDRLSPDDAHFVDIIHTDGGMLGFRGPIGIVDFFPNGGTAVQPGCSLMKSDVRYEDLFCSHASSHRMFIRSILNTGMKAIPCDSWERYEQGQCDESQAVVFGEETPSNISGTYFLKTPEDIITQPIKND